MSNTITPNVFYRTLNVEGLETFYREGGPRDAPTVLPLHGLPSFSHTFRNLIPMLAEDSPEATIRATVNRLTKSHLTVITAHPRTDRSEV